MTTTCSLSGTSLRDHSHNNPSRTRARLGSARSGPRAGVFTAFCGLDQTGTRSFTSSSLQRRHLSASLYFQATTLCCSRYRTIECEPRSSQLRTRAERGSLPSRDGQVLTHYSGVSPNIFAGVNGPLVSLNKPLLVLVLTQSASVTVNYASLLYIS